MNTLAEKFTTGINQNPSGFSQPKTGKHRMARGGFTHSKYEVLIAQECDDSSALEREESERGKEKRASRKLNNSKVSEHRAEKYRHSSAS